MVYAEAAGWAMQTGSLAVYDPRSAPGGLTLERLREFFAARLPQIPIYRQHLVTLPGDLGRPVWVEDAEVDLTQHIEEIELTAPGASRQLCALVGELFAIPLDMTRPLWRMWLITGLEDDAVAVLTVVHHAVSDGVRGQEVSAASFDLDPDAPLHRDGELTGAGTDQPGRARLLGGAAAELAATPWRVARAGIDVGRAVTRVIGMRTRGQQQGLARPADAPWVRFNGRVGKERSFAYCSLPLAPVKTWAKANGGTVNDAILTLTGGALRRYLQGRDELPDQPLLVNIPIGHASTDDGRGKVGNSFSVMIGSLATDLADPVDRMHRIMESTRAAKAMQSALGDKLMSDVLNAVPAPVFALSTKTYSRLGLARFQHPSANAVVSNIRGPASDLYLAGARMLAHYPVGPVSDGLGLNVTLLSYRDSIDVGITSSPALVEDLYEIGAALRTEVDQLTS